MDIISSGPTVPDESTFEDAYKIIKKYSLEDKILNSVYSFLRNGKMGKVKETPKNGDKIFDNTQNVIVGSNKIALDAAEEKELFKKGDCALKNKADKQYHDSEIFGN